METESHMVVFEAFAGALLFVHLVTAVVALGSAVHLAVRLWRGAGSAVVRLHGTLTTAAFTACYLTGCLIYPTFRVRVRAELFDGTLPWATGLFEAKEHLATLGLVAVVSLALMLRQRPRSGRPWRGRQLAAGLLALVLAVLAFNAWTGWFLTSLRSI